MSEADEWAALIKELEDKKMMTAKLSLTDFTLRYHCKAMGKPNRTEGRT